MGEEYVIDETDEIIYIGTDFPDEYANSRYSTKALGTIGKAKANAAQAVPELVKTATYFSLPTCDDSGNVIGRNHFQGRKIIRCDANGTKYLYDKG